MNALLLTPAGARFLEARDTSGQTKDARYVADFVVEPIRSVGVDKVVAVCMDGACVSSFPLITAELRLPHDIVFCYICPTHAIDNFLNNVCGSAEKNRVRSVKTCEDEDFAWDTDVFSKPIEDSYDHGP